MKVMEGTLLNEAEDGSDGFDSWQNHIEIDEENNFVWIWQTHRND
jgi:hypothetical protein